MRILHVCLRYPPALGGVERYVHDLVERTRDISQGRDVRVLTSRLRTHGPVSDLAPEQLLDDPAYVQRLHYKETPRISYPRLQALPYYIRHHNPDIIHAYSFWYQPADVAARYARRYGISFIFHPMFYTNAIRQKPLWRLYEKTYGRATFAAADAVAVLSPFEQQLIEKAGFPVRRFELLPPGIAAAADTQLPDPFAARDIAGTILLGVGRISESKGYQDVLAVLPDLKKQFPDLQFVLVGSDFGAQKNLLQQAEQLGVKEAVHIVGELSETDLAAAYQHAHIFVHPSHYEAFGIAPAEAQAAGLPIVARRVAATPYVVQHKKTGLLFTTQEELRTQIAQLLSNPQKRAAFGAAGKAHVRSSFSPEAVTKKVLSLYDELILQRK